MNYPEALAYLDSFINLERSAQTAEARALITLESVRTLATRLGDPQRAFRTVHVAGTKGKGSTCAFAASILTAAGLRVGLYSSPHLQDIRERISNNGTLISESDFARLLTAAYPVLEELRQAPAGQRRPTYFEILTHLAFAWFAEQRVDCAVVEVGLGGRLDATNIIEPEACGITSISFDHMAILGNTLSQIAGEKAGIIKPGVPVVVAPQTDEALSAIVERAQAMGAPLERIGVELRAEQIEDSSAEKATSWPHPRGRVTLPDGRQLAATLGLHGPFQIENWAVAVRLADLLYRRLKGQPIPAAAVESGSRNVVWPGRLEEVLESPRIVLDGAHNDYSLKLVCNELLARPWSRPFVVLFACAKDKDHSAMLKALADAAPNAVVFTHSGNVRGREPSDLAEAWKTFTPLPANLSADAATGLSKARELAGPGGMVLVTGSLYLVGAVKDVIAHKS
jgi:dihydrofolate synthase/folylpolyglutamate synthase